MTRHTTAGTLLAATLAGCTLGAAAQQAGGPVQRIEIIGITPVPGTGVPRDQIPANAQTADDGRLRRSHSLNLPDFLAGQLPSVSINEVQGNPYQIDVNYRGFTASPLLGTPQGLSVFQDGVRINEPFGDVVNWDLIPKAALASITLLPGSNPLFGLNTLGGALSLQTKSGDSHPGTEVELQGGSFGRRSVELSHGRRLGDSGHLFVAASGFDEDGWRDASPSRVRQLFVKTGQHGSTLRWDLSLTHGDNRLVGNGPLPESMLAARRSQVYTLPDVTGNRMSLLALNALWKPAAGLEVAGTAYTRRARASTLNGDLNDDYDPPSVSTAGVEHRTHSSQRSDGLALQASTTLAGHRVTLGVSQDRAHSSFEQTAALGDLDASRAVVPTEDAQVDARIDGHSRTGSAYFAALLALRPTLQLTLSGRANSTRVATSDIGRAQLGLPTALDSDARYRKFNPALGLTWQATPALTAYGGFSQGNRAPSPIELGCSDPANACVLPNALQSDPPLKQVVSRTLEGGLRGNVAMAAGGAEPLRWNASAYRTVNQDDLLFISNGHAAGYFTNFGRTRRQGVEIGLSQRGGRLDWAVSYSALRATFESPACIVAAANSSASTSPACPGDDEIEIRPGNRLPGLPAQTLKLNVELRPGTQWRLGVQLNANAGQVVRGNENNAHQADGGAFQGAGRVGGFALLHLTGAWQLAEHWELFGKVANVLDRRYASAGLLGRDAFGPTGGLKPPVGWQKEQFVGPGAPRSFWLGLRWTWGQDAGA